MMDYDFKFILLAFREQYQKVKKECDSILLNLDYDQKRVHDLSCDLHFPDKGMSAQVVLNYNLRKFLLLRRFQHVFEEKRIVLNREVLENARKNIKGLFEISENEEIKIQDLELLKNQYSALENSDFSYYLLDEVVDLSDQELKKIIFQYQGMKFLSMNMCMEYSAFDDQIRLLNMRSGYFTKRSFEDFLDLKVFEENFLLYHRDVLKKYEEKKLILPDDFVTQQKIIFQFQDDADTIRMIRKKS